MRLRRGLGRQSFLALPLALGFLGFPTAAHAQGDAPHDIPPTGLAVLLQEYRTLAPPDEGIRISGRTARIGRMRFDFEEGVLFPLQGASKQVLGAYFEGRGFYFYQSEGGMDRQTLAFNLSQFAVAPRLQEGILSDPFTHALMVFGPSMLAEILAPPGPAVDTPASRDAGLIANFQRRWQSMGKGVVPWDHRATQATLNGNGRKYFYAEIDGKSRPLGYCYDGVENNDERVFFFARGSRPELQSLDTLSIQRLPEGSGSAEPDLVLKDIQLQVSTEDNRSGRVRSDLTLWVSQDKVRIARLALVNNLAADPADWKSEKSSVHVHRVTNESGRERPCSHRYHEVLVELPVAANKGDLINLRFDTEWTGFTGMYGESFNNYFTLFGFPWFPSPSGWGESGYSFGLNAKTRKPFLPVASGSTRSLKEVGDFYELEAESTRPMRGIALFAGKYIVQEQKFPGLLVKVHALSAREDLMKIMPGIAYKFVQFYNSVLGDYPFADLDLVEMAQFVGNDLYIGHGGVAPPGMVLLTTEAFHARLSEFSEYFSEGANSRLAHEVAHQWFGHKAIPGSPRDRWIAESGAEYMSGMAMAAAQPSQTVITGYPRMLAEWQADAKLCEKNPIEIAYTLEGDNGAMERLCLLYKRGPLVLHMLHTMVGNERFYAILKTFLDQANNGLVSLEDLQLAARNVLQTDMDWFFQQWIRGAGTPEVHTQYTVKESGGKFTLIARATQPPGGSFKKLLIPFVVDYGAGKREVKLLFEDRPEVEGRFELQQKPLSVAVDPSHNNLAVYR